MTFYSRFRHLPHKVQASLVRNTVFGVEDSLVSTVALLSGVAITGANRSTLLITGAVLVFVQGFSTGTGSLLAEISARDYLLKKHPAKKVVRRSYYRILGYALANFLSYILAGIVPMVPYVFTEGYQALGLSIGLSLIALFLFGMLESHYASLQFWRGALRMFLIGGVSIGLGVLVGILAIEIA